MTLNPVKEINNKTRHILESAHPYKMPSQKTAYDYLISGGYEFVQSTPMEDGRFEVVLCKNGKTVTLLTEEPFKEGME